MQPALTPRVFSWKTLPADSPMELLSRRRVIGEKAMISHVTLEKGCFVPAHAHENEQFVCLMEGCLKLCLGAADDARRQEVVLRAGDVLHIPSNLPHDATALERTVVLDVFSPPSCMTGIDKKTE